MNIRISIVSRGRGLTMAVRAPDGTGSAEVLRAAAARLGLPEVHAHADEPLRHGVVLNADPAAQAWAPVAGPEGGGEGARLCVTAGPAAGSVYPLSGNVTIGRASANDIALDDPEVSRRHVEIDTRRDVVTVRDLGSRNGTAIDGRRLPRVPVGWSDGALRLGATTMHLRPAAQPRANTRLLPSGYMAVNRAPRLMPAAQPQVVALPAKPSLPSRPTFPALGILAPLVALGVMALVLGSRWLVVGAVAPVAGLGQWLAQRRSWKVTCAGVLAQHARREREAADRIEAALQAERRSRDDRDPDLAHVLTTALGPTHEIWRRRRTDSDALSVRVGRATIAAETRVVVPDSAPLTASEPTSLQDAPVALDLQRGPVGVCGPRPVRSAMATSWLGQLSVWHSPEQVRLVILAPNSALDWAWATWLPHVRAPRATDPAAASLTLVGFDAGQVSDRLSELTAELDRRSVEVALGSRGLTAAPAIVVLLDGALELRQRAEVPRLLTEGAKAGIHLVCLDDDRAALPAECRAQVTLSAHPLRGDLRIDGEQGCPDVRPDLPARGWAERLARALAPLTDDTAPAGPSLPDNARLWKLLGLPQRLDGAHLFHAWLQRPRSMDAVVGVSVDGPVALDLRRDGPHILVAGTSGAGKSELLQTLVASLAVGNRPDAVTFLLIDYKGGAAFRECAALPHVLGVVSDLDPQLTGRALRSLRAEVRRREAALLAAEAADLDTYHARRDARGTPDDPIPRLVVVVDELATLAAELPQFVDGLVDIGRRGRSLGIHLVLATQRPAGVISAELRANVALRIALRVADPAASHEILEVGDAALLPGHLPGRALIRRAGSPALQLMQTARVSDAGEAPPTTRLLVEELDVRRLGDRIPLATPDEAQATQVSSDLCLVAAAASAATRMLDIPALQPPWLPPLPAKIGRSILRAEHVRAGAADCAWIGLLDDPDRQAQPPYALDLWLGPVAIVGGPRSGRSTALLTCASALYDGGSAQRSLQIFAFEATPGSLSELDHRAPATALVGSDEPERLARLTARLLGELDRRARARRRPAVVGAEPGPTGADDKPPEIVILIDGWEAVLAAVDLADPGASDGLVRILMEGSGLAMHVVASGDRRLLMGRHAAAFATRLLLPLADSAEYALLGVRPSDAPSDPPPGRALTQHGLSVQICLPDLPLTRGEAVVTPDASASHAVSAAGGRGQPAVRSAAGGGGGAAGGGGARPLPSIHVERLPLAVSLADCLHGSPPSPAVGLEGSLAAGGRPDLWIPLGKGGDTAGVLGLDLGQLPVLLVAGQPRSGVSTLLVAIADSLTASDVPVLQMCEVSAPDPRTVAQFHACVARGDPCVLVVDDVHLTGSPDRQRLLELILQRLRSPSGRTRPGPAVVAGAKLADCSRAWSGSLADLRSHRTGVVLGEATGAEREVFGVRVPRRPDAPAPPGRGHLVIGSQVLALQAMQGRAGGPSAHRQPEIPAVTDGPGGELTPRAAPQDRWSRLDVTA